MQNNINIEIILAVLSERGIRVFESNKKEELKR